MIIQCWRCNIIFQGIWWREKLSQATHPTHSPISAPVCIICSIHMVLLVPVLFIRFRRSSQTPNCCGQQTQDELFRELDKTLYCVWLKVNYFTKAPADLFCKIFIRLTNFLKVILQTDIKQLCTFGSLFLIVKIKNTPKNVLNIFTNGRKGMHLRKSNLQITMN